MSNQSRASVAELTAEFERAMENLAKDPVDTDEPEDWIVEIQHESDEAYALIGSSDDLAGQADLVFADHLTRIAAIALEGAARLRREK